MTYIEKLQDRYSKTQNLLCSGIDVNQSYIECNAKNLNLSFLEICLQLIDATAEFSLCFKPQIAYFSAVGEEKTLEKVIDYVHSQYPQIPVILDAKRGDIGTTAEKYAEEAFVRYQADAVTINPYMGIDAVEPFLKYKNKGAIILARTSNPSSKFLLTEIEDKPLYLHWAKHIVEEASNADNIQFVVGATDLEAISIMRQHFPKNWLLIPGVGAQGGKANDVIQTATSKNGHCPMTLINVSRGLLPVSPTHENFSSEVKKLARNYDNTIKNTLIELG